MRDKQIEEMARDICECYNCDGTCYQDDKQCDLRCDEYTNAQYLYHKGYRKASDVAREIFEEIEEHAEEVGFSSYTERFEFADFIAELKKKYESEGEG